MTVVVDARVLIGLLDPRDAHHDAALALFESPEREYLVHNLNLADALVGPERGRRGLGAFEDLRRLGLTPADLGPNEALKQLAAAARRLDLLHVASIGQ